MQVITTEPEVGVVYEVADPVIGFADVDTLKVLSLGDGFVEVEEFPVSTRTFKISDKCLFRTLMEV